MTCRNCIYEGRGFLKEPCKECYATYLRERVNPNFKAKNQWTNAARIRATTDDEAMAKEIDRIRKNAEITMYGWASILDWLHEEADNE